MENPIKSIITFNQKAGLLEYGYSDFYEPAYQIEEALEGFTSLNSLSNKLNEGIEHKSGNTPKDISRTIMSIVISENRRLDNDQIYIMDTKDVDRLDKACRIIIRAINSMQQLDLDIYQITKALCVKIDKENRKEILLDILEKQKEIIRG